MLQCVVARRDDKIRIENKLMELKFESLQKQAVARRSQILSQYSQTVRAIREKKLELLGKQWYDIQHDRRGYAGNVPDYALKYPPKRSQQITHQMAYNKEVSILSGIAKYVGFPAAPAMSAATPVELEDDLDKMGVSLHSLMQQMNQVLIMLCVDER